MIVSAFPGTGKSFYTIQHNNEKVCDSDSSHFDKQYFPDNYIEHIKKKIKENTSIIFVSSHKDVRDALVKNNLDFTLIYPDKSLKEDYLKRYENRGSNKAFIELIDKNWNEWLEDCEKQENCKHIVLKRNEFIINVI